MPHEVVLGAIYAALKTLLAGTAPLTALIGTKPISPFGAAIYDEGAVPQAATTVVHPATTWPSYLTIGAGTQVPDHTMGEDGLARFGWNCTLQIKAVGQSSEALGLAIMSEVAKALKPGAALTLVGYTRTWCEEITLHPTIVTVQAGVTTREWPVILRVIASDT